MRLYGRTHLFILEMAGKRHGQVRYDSRQIPRNNVGLDVEHCQCTHPRKCQPWVSFTHDALHWQGREIAGKCVNGAVFRTEKLWQEKPRWSHDTVKPAFNYTDLLTQTSTDGQTYKHSNMGVNTAHLVFLCFKGFYHFHSFFFFLWCLSVKSWGIFVCTCRIMCLVYGNACIK